MFPPTIIVIGYNFEKYRAISTGLGLAGSSFGSLCLAPLFYFTTQNYGWRVTLKVQSTCLIICMIASIAYRPLKPVKVMVSEVQESSSVIISSPSFHMHTMNFFSYSYGLLMFRSFNCMMILKILQPTLRVIHHKNL